LVVLQGITNVHRSQTQEAFSFLCAGKSSLWLSLLAWLARPGRPEDSGISLDIIQRLGPEVPVFGVCMGHQCIGQVFGGRVVRAPGGVMHGKTSLVYHNNTSLLKVSQRLPLRSRETGRSTCLYCHCSALSSRGNATFPAIFCIISGGRGSCEGLDPDNMQSGP
jgi:hypothetical protein